MAKRNSFGRSLCSGFIAYLSRLWHGLEQTADKWKLVLQYGFVCLCRI